MFVRIDKCEIKIKFNEFNTHTHVLYYTLITSAVKGLWYCTKLIIST